jgi:putative DNA primase/helicase
MSELPFDPEKVAAAARAKADPIPLAGYPDDDNVVPFAPPTPSEGIIPLGYDHGTFFYLSRASRQIHALTADQHTKRAMMALASVPHFWQRSKFVSDKGNVFWDDAAGWLMDECHAIGIYNPERVRGRGAWFDAGRAVLHLGDRLLVDGRAVALMLPDSSAIYPAALSLGVTTADPLSSAEAHQLVTLAKGLRWKQPVSAVLFSGWVVDAMICGALKWRPSIWITGATGSGKSWLQENVLAPLVGPVALQVQSKTSEAGIRQTLNSDALPVIFDEFEREDSAAAIRVQGVLDLMRQASSESEKKIVKGTQQQTTARAFRIRSCFCFSSINVGIAHAADESRVTVLTLEAPEIANVAAQDKFQALAASAATLITPQFAAGLLARSVGLLAVIRQNAETFAQAVAAKLGTRRLGDQLGTLLAGAYSLHSNRVITLEKAAAYVADQVWGDVTETDLGHDDGRLLSQLTAHRVRLSQGNGPALDLTLGRLLSSAFGADAQIAKDVATTELRDYGILAIVTAPFGVWVSNSHPSIAKALAGSPWHAGWSRSLVRMTGAEASGKKTLRFGLGHVSKAVWLPLETIDADGAD